MRETPSEWTLVHPVLDRRVDRMAEEVDPDRQQQDAQPHVRHADPDELVVDDALQDLGIHRHAFLDRRRIEMRENHLLREEDADDRTDRIDRLREVQPPNRALWIADRENARIRRRLQDRAPARHDEDAEKVEVEALLDAGRDVEERTDHIRPESDQHARPEGELLDEDGREHGQDRIRPVERDLHEDGPVLVHREDTLERRHEVVRHVVDEPPQREVEEHQKHREGRVLLHRSVPQCRMSIVREPIHLKPGTDSTNSSSRADGAREYSESSATAAGSFRLPYAFSKTSAYALACAAQ